MEKKTAVQWLISKIEEKNGKEHISYCYEFFEQALAMEREQIEEAVMFGDCRGRNTQYLTASEYYTKTYSEPTKDKL